MSIENINKINIPDLVFIVPYRDRELEKMVFISVMEKILSHLNYKIFFIHQNDKRLFNRGAIKNIGFLYVKKCWPDNYKNITLIINDIDSLPYYKDQFNFQTKENIIKHHFGFKHTLGGFFSIIASDFEKINGFPNIWTWGLEDNILLKRVKKINIHIDYSNFVNIKTDYKKKIINFNNYKKRNINKNIQFKIETNSIFDGISLIKNIKYGKEHHITNDISMIDIDYFETGEDYKLYLDNTNYIPPVKTFKKINRTFSKKKNMFKTY